MPAWDLGNSYGGLPLFLILLTEDESIEKIGAVSFVATNEVIIYCIVYCMYCIVVLCPN